MALALALALLLSACGGGGDAPPPPERATLAAKSSPGNVTACPAFPAGPLPLASVPTAEQVLGFAWGSREVTNEEAALYMRTLDAASPRVVTGVAARSVQGRELGYAIVGREDRLTPAGLDAVRTAIARLADPATSPEAAAGSVDGAMPGVSPRR